jgi:hypothetical protein
MTPEALPLAQGGLDPLPPALRDRRYVDPGLTPGGLDDQVLGVPERRPTWAWFAALGFTAAITALGLLFMGQTLVRGIGLWGNNSPVFWGFGIINFVFWVGIGHAGTLISAILLLFRQRLRHRKRMAEISGPAWPRPTQNTKLMMSKAQNTGLLLPQAPIPL